MNSVEIIGYVQDKYGFLKPDITSSIDGNIMCLFKIAHGFPMCDSDISKSKIDGLILSSLLSAKELVDESIIKFKIKNGKREVVNGVEIVKVGDEYWASADAMVALEHLIDEDSEYPGALFYNKVPVIYQPVLDS